MDNIIYRDFKKTDIDIFQKSVRKTWRFDELANEKLAYEASKAYVLSCLVMSNKIIVAEKDNLPLGVIMLKTKTKIKFKYELSLIKSMIKILFLKPSKELIKIAKDFQNANNELFKTNDKNYDAVLELFIVTEESRGLGIGKKLYFKALDYIKEQNKNSFYLYTDTLCNYKFYEIMGMKQVSKKDISFLDEAATVFLYEGLTSKTL